MVALGVVEVMQVALHSCCSINVDSDEGHLYMFEAQMHGMQVQCTVHRSREAWACSLSSSAFNALSPSPHHANAVDLHVLDPN